MTFDEVWNRLERSGIFNTDSTNQNISKESTFRDVSKLCKMGKAQALSDRVEDKIKDIVHASLVEMRNKASEFQEAVDFLNFFKEFWISFCMRM